MFPPAYVYQIEPGSQTEQPPPSAVFRLGPEDMHGFRFLTISVAPRPVLLAFILFIKIFSFNYITCTALEK